ncbi:hypothetical protein CONLIGDRAFT_637587 [Coniochaeta ligniaria NRRL 30616]|uniref:Mid2 domain-containing protein n=1 Tax=Coniochaeta ligniaria NRRL 30616 TaxID=1408157 RepID=A0A1J7IR94_9PEZI|nr:hypothetical protein CONLIGDRAFT_637587 [Coniochaeta ligniaria NRRL 30616]
MATAKLPETNSGVVTSWIPITTGYPSVQGCDKIYWSVDPNPVAAWDPGYGLLVADSSCLPRPVTTWWDQQFLGTNTDTVLSIGPVTCPQAYYTAKTSVKDSSSTLVGCCPIGYTFASFLGHGNPGQCMSNLDAGQVITYAVKGQGGNFVITTQSILSKTIVAGIPVNGWVFAQETDTASTACATATTTIVSLPRDTGLSNGAKAGIGVGVSLGVIGLLTLLAGIWMMRRARRRGNGDGSGAMAQHAHEYDPRYPAGYGGLPVETTAHPISEMTTSRSHLGASTVRDAPVELSEDRLAELPINYTPHAEPDEANNGHYHGGGGLR